MHGTCHREKMKIKQSSGERVKRECEIVESSRVGGLNDTIESDKDQDA